MPETPDYSRLDGPLIQACEETPEDQRSLTVFVHTQVPPTGEQVKVLSDNGVSTPDSDSRIFTATISPAQVARLSKQEWVKRLKLSQTLKKAGNG